MMIASSYPTSAPYVRRQPVPNQSRPQLRPDFLRRPRLLPHDRSVDRDMLITSSSESWLSVFAQRPGKRGPCCTPKFTKNCLRFWPTILNIEENTKALPVR